ncbi:hypothetical protein GJAV_G00081840 [Gymnothorax javanicus]|nr:hypothetical protein GJAV_G00081840 [Gymnothorax javanicus]
MIGLRPADPWLYLRVSQGRSFRPAPHHQKPPGSHLSGPDNSANSPNTLGTLLWTHGLLGRRGPHPKRGVEALVRRAVC